MIECPIHKVARNGVISDNECKSCKYFNDCFEMMLSDMSEETMHLWAKYIKEMQDTIREHIAQEIQETVAGYAVKKVKEGK